MGRMIENRLNYTIPFGAFVIEKLDLTGTQIWTDTLSGYVHLQGLLIDPEDNVFAYGQYRDSLGITGSDFELITGSETHAWIARFNPTGELMWFNDLTLSNPNLSIISQICQGSDYLWMASDNGFTGSAIYQLDPDGLITPYIEQTGVRGIFSLSEDGQGGLWVTGATGMGGLDFNGSLFTAPHPYNQYIVRYTSTGSAQWVRFIEDITFEKNQIVTDDQGFGYFASALHGAFQFGDIQAQGPDWVFDFVLTKLDSNGNFLWLREVPLDDQLGDAGTGSGSFLDIGPDNSVYFSGFSRHSIDWGNGVFTQGDTYYDVLLLNFASNGQIMWGKTAGNEWLDSGDAVAVDSQGNVWLAGRCGETASFDSITVTGTFTNAFVARLSMNPTSMDVSEAARLPQFTLGANYPNPFNPSTMINYSLSQGSKVDLRVYDVTGREVSILTNDYQSSGSHSASLSAQDLPAGVYIYRMTTERGVQSRKMLLVK